MTTDVETQYENALRQLSALWSSMRARFDALDARFDKLESKIDAKFSRIDTKLDSLRADIPNIVAVAVRAALRERK